jgi:signal transduction histidine kinase
MALAVQEREAAQIDALNQAREAREKAERSDQVKSAFLASMSHELRTPLNAVINFTKFVVKGTMGPINEEQEEMLNEAIDSAKHLLNLINDVLDVAKIESGSLTLFFEDNVDLSVVLKPILSTGKTLLAGKPVSFEVEIEENLPPIRADRQRILQIVLNLVSNACKFTEEGSIKLAGERQGDEILLTVKDTGPGIAPEDHVAVFQTFKQTETGLRQGGGTGLGMPISKSLAEAHGGQLWLESGLGQGATFYVTLPLKPENLSPEMALLQEMVK